jgi:hypothetical protein
LPLGYPAERGYQLVLAPRFVASHLREQDGYEALSPREALWTFDQHGWRLACWELRHFFATAHASGIPLSSLQDCEVLRLVRQAVSQNDLLVMRPAPKNSPVNDATAEQRKLIRQIEKQPAGELVHAGRRHKLVADVDLSKVPRRDDYEVLARDDADRVLDAIGLGAQSPPELAELLVQAREKLSRDWRPPLSPDGLVLLRRMPTRGAFKTSKEAPLTPSQMKKLLGPHEWIEIEVLDEDGKPYEGLYELQRTNGSTGTLDKQGFFGEYDIDAGTCKFSAGASGPPRPRDAPNPAQNNVVTPTIDAEYKVVLLDRGLAAHQTGEPDAEKVHPDPIRIEVSVAESNRAQHPFKTTAKLKCVPENVEIFRDKQGTTKLAGDLKADEIAGGKKLALWLRGKTRGKFELSLEFADTGDPTVCPVKDAPKTEMGVVELIMEIGEHDLPAIKAIKVDPDEEPIATYHTNLKNKVLPDQKPMTDEAKVKTGRLLHEQKDAHHGRAKLTLKKLTADQWPAGTDDYQIFIGSTAKSGDASLYEVEWDAAAKPFPVGPFKVSELKAADKVLWVEGKTACSKLRDVRLDVTLDRTDGGIAKEAKRNGDWARFTVVKIDEVKLDYTAAAGTANAWDAANHRFFINLKADPDGRKITIGAKLSKEIDDIVIHFMLVEHTDNRKAANWGVALPDGTRVLHPSAVVNDVGTPQVFPANEPQWVWKDIAAAVKHLDKADRKDLLHLSAKTVRGYAKQEVTLSRFGGDKFYLAAYIEQDPHLAKYIDGHADLGKRKPPRTADPIQVWRRFWYKEVKVRGLLVSGFLNAPDTYGDVKAVMAAGTVVEMPRVDADAINPKVIYPKHMVSYYLDATGSYRNNYPGDAGDALVVGDANESRFFRLAHAEADKPVMYAMLNAHALWVAGGTVAGVPASVGPGTHPWATPDDFNNSRVKIRFNQQFLDPPLQGGNLLVRGSWAAQDWVAHPNPATPSGPDRPAGAPPGSWGNNRNGNLAAGNVSLDPNRNDPREVRVTLPTGLVVAAYTRVRIFDLHARCAANFLGTSYPDGIVNAYTPNDVADFVNTINHETGHSFTHVNRSRPGNSPQHPLQYQNQGGHCAYDNKSCVMYESGPQPTSLNRFCPVCHPYLLVSDMSTVRGRLT